MVQAAERTKRRHATAPSGSEPRRSPRSGSRSPVSPLSLRTPTIQPKLTVNQPGDKYEQEADAVASRVMSAPAPISQPDEGRASIQRQPEDDLQRQEDETVQMQAEEEETVQRKGTGTPNVSAATASTIRSPGAGSPLPASTRHRIEPHVGANLSGVRIHTDPRAHQATSNLQARAFTHRNHIFLNKAESSSNLSLMAHESTHVVQQGAAPVQRSPLPSHAPIQRQPTPAADSPEVQRLPGFIMEELEEYARYIPGYTLFTVIIGYDPLRGEDVPFTAINLLEGLMGLVPFGTAIFDALQEYGIIQTAFTWVSDELNRLNLSLERIERTVQAIWDEVGFTGLAYGVDYVVGVARRHFSTLYNDVVEFATSLVNHIIELIKEAAIDVVEPLLAENRAWALIKKILHYDPLRDEEVEASTVEILEDFLLLIGKEQELEQMREQGTLQETADWLDTQFALFTSLVGQLRGIITDVWNAIQPENLPDLGSNLENLAERVVGFLEGVWTFASTVALKVLELIKNALLGQLSTFANDIPGYHLLTVILERDPFTQAEVPRNATNLIRGFMGLIPGGEQQFQQMQESGVIPQAAQRIEGMMTELGITWPFVQQLFLDLWNAFTIEDLLQPIDAFIRILDQFQEPLTRLFTFVIEVIKVVLELILVMMNFPTDLIGSIITNALQALDDIQQNPVGFLMNLLETAKLGFQKFFDNILDHLIGGLTDWLFRAVRDAGIEPPQDFSFGSILGFVLDVMGLTADHLWELLGDHIGEDQAQSLRETIERGLEVAGEAWAFIQDVQERGIVAVWEYIQSQLTNLWDIIIGQVQSYVMERVIMVGMRWLLSLLDATGITPVINSFIAFFNAIQSAIEYLRDMLEVVNDFVSTVASIAAGDIEPGATRMEEGLGNSIPIVIGFIANQLGLGNISERLGEIIGSIREMVDRALNWLIEQALRIGGAILNRLGLGDEGNEEASDQENSSKSDFDSDAEKISQPFYMAGEQHTLFITEKNGSLVIEMASDFRKRLINLIGEAEIELKPRRRSASLLKQLQNIKKELIDFGEDIPALKIGYHTNPELTLEKLEGKVTEYARQLEGIGKVYHIKSLSNISHRSQYVENDKIKPEYDIRRKFYPGFGDMYSTWRNPRLKSAFGRGNGLQDPNNSSHFISEASLYQENQFYPGTMHESIIGSSTYASIPKGDASIDHHPVSVVEHWNDHNGNNMDQLSREIWYKNTGNLRIISGRLNSSLSSGDAGNYKPEVKSEFRGPDDPP
jgi:phage-related protein